ncbi:styrene monooxygenase subunit StyA [Prauserella muralis]|uniref:Monooxygenase n=1 Tax=Prauserella muralis TaxID=588067 RepID=A0A2V4B3D8_9PSEU|nr:styrene monooxygenase/indole monooxygenase family protein [Prauserella muralis]PXY22965.1 monooxygenase [Prauserella muralis]TWE28308.1 2-polyprenyl-6-methoxyphenol hydroxylase-like FAD-dependent oxidoreductase [Prauserella muralis]
MPNIGIVGAGIAGLHLGLLLRRHDVPVTIYTDKSPAQLANGRLLNSVAHHAPTIERERELGVHFWPVEEYGYACHHHYVGGEQPLSFRGDFARASSAIDYRLYLPRLAEAYEERGGKLDVRLLQAEDLEPLAEAHDLLVVAAGRGAFSALFPRREDASPYDRPQRRLCVGLYRGIAESQPKGVTISVSPGHGELLEIPLYSAEGFVTALLFENIPGGDLEVLADLSYADDPKAFERTVLDKLATHHPQTFERVDPARFELTGPLDLLQGALTPTVRQDYAKLPNGKYALAIGDVHTVVDPVIGQGANSASHSAWVTGQEILSDYGFDELFCRRVAAARADVVLGAANWTNLMLAPPPEHLLELFGAMARHQHIADEFTDNFDYPDRQWQILATAERTREYLARRTGSAA